MAISGQNNGGDEFAVMRSELNQPIMEESENLPPAEKPLVSARSGHRKPIKASSKGTGEIKSMRKLFKLLI